MGRRTHTAAAGDARGTFAPPGRRLAHLAGRSLKALPEAIEPSDATELDASHNQLRSLSLRALTGVAATLTTLLLDHNELTAPALGFPVLPNLSTLSLAHNNIADLDRVCRQLQGRFPQLSQLSLLQNPVAPSPFDNTRLSRRLSMRLGVESPTVAYRTRILAAVPSLGFLDCARVTDGERAAAQARAMPTAEEATRAHEARVAQVQATLQKAKSKGPADIRILPALDDEFMDERIRDLPDATVAMQVEQKLRRGCAVVFATRLGGAGAGDGLEFEYGSIAPLLEKMAGVTLGSGSFQEDEYLAWRRTTDHAGFANERERFLAARKRQYDAHMDDLRRSNEACVAVLRMQAAAEDMMTPPKFGALAIILQGGKSASLEDRALATPDVMDALLQWLRKHKILDSYSLIRQATVADLDDLDYATVRRKMFHEAIVE